MLLERGVLRARVRRLGFRRACSWREPNDRRRKKQKRSSDFPCHSHAAQSVTIAKLAVKRGGLPLHVGLAPRIDDA
jgi:hypothetical protein